MPITTSPSRRPAPSQPSLSAAMATTVAAAAAAASKTATVHCKSPAALLGIESPYSGRRRVGARPRGGSRQAGQIAERQSGRASREQQASGSVALREHVSRSSSAAGVRRRRGSALRASRSSQAAAAP
ncbi:Os11g0204200 [Oryza sativa Japonica Group]|nr:Os11g0204200 [Oryza sativa Japonica Group]